MSETMVRADPDLSDGDRDLPPPSSTSAISLSLDAPTSRWLVGTTISPEVSDEIVLAGVSVFVAPTAIATEPPNVGCEPEEDPSSENISFLSMSPLRRAAIRLITYEAAGILAAPLVPTLNPK